MALLTSLTGKNISLAETKENQENKRNLLYQEIIVGLQRKRSGGETGLKCVEPEAGLWKIPQNHTAHIEKSLIDVFPSLMAILTLYMALLTTGCEVERNLQKPST